MSNVWKHMCGMEGSPIPVPHGKLVQQTKNLKKKKQ
jgi:hypothetical protein